MSVQKLLKPSYLLEDESILSELRSEDGNTGQRFVRKLNISSRAHFSSAQIDISTCLENNPVWKTHILRILDEIQNEFPESEVDVSINNPSTGVLTLYFLATKEDGILYLPNYSLTVYNPEPVRMYFGSLEVYGEPLTYQQILNKYYHGELSSLLLLMTWGGYDSRDADIIEDLGLAYRSYYCDIKGDDRKFFYLRDDRWRVCPPVDIFNFANEYFLKNEAFVRHLINKIHRHDLGGLFEIVDIEQKLDEQVEFDNAIKKDKYFIDSKEKCDLCDCLFLEEKYMIDGSIKGHGAWACMCAECFSQFGKGLGCGSGQLYLQIDQKWLLVVGSCCDEDDTSEE